MIITYGTSYVGRVDRVPGKCYLVTKVFQIASLPLVPLSGYLVHEGTETTSAISGLRAFQGEATPIVWKSFAWAWARTLLLIGGLLALLGVLPMLCIGIESQVAGIASVVSGGLMLFLWWRTRRGLPATSERASQLLGQLVGLPAARLVRSAETTTPAAPARAARAQSPRQTPPPVKPPPAPSTSRAPALTPETMSREPASDDAAGPRFLR